MQVARAQEPTVPDPDTMEKRAHERVALAAEITATSESNFFAGFTENISEGGVFVSTLAPPAIGERITVNLQLPDEEPLVVEGIVRWIREDESGPTGCGVQFVDLDPRTVGRLGRLVARLGREPLFMEFD